MRPRAVLSCLLLCLLALPGCALWHRKRKPTPPPPARPMAVGTVTLVNDEGKFVLVDNGPLPVPPVGGVLKCYPGRATVPTAELVATDVRKRPFTIADIREGVPHKGDRVIYLPPELLRGTKPKLTDTQSAAAPEKPQVSTAGPGAQ